jgi:xanthine dehydrogenase accessory factor
MRDILPDLDKWGAQQNQSIALATVIQTWGSSPRRAGAKMALTPDGKITGSVSGGCVEGAVFESGVETMQTGRPQLLKFGVADETAWEVGLACGGQIEVFVQPLDAAIFAAQSTEILANRPYGLASVVDGPTGLLGGEVLVTQDRVTTSLEESLAEILAQKARPAMKAGRSQRFSFDWKDETLQVFVEVVNPPPTLVIVGGVHIAIALTAIAKTLGYTTLLVDPRRAFGNAERFPQVDRLIPAWPEEAFEEIHLNSETAVAMLTHDPKIDDPALKIALNSPAFYVGALGSRKTQDKRRQRLLAEGLTPEQLDRLYGPIGLDIGGETPEEIAVAIMAQIVAARRSRQPVKQPAMLAPEA